MCARVDQLPGKGDGNPFDGHINPTIGLMSLSLISNGSNGSLDHRTAQHVYNFWSDFSPLFFHSESVSPFKVPQQPHRSFPKRWNL